MKNIIYSKTGTVQLIDDDSEIVKEVRPGFYKVKEEMGFFFSSMALEVDKSVKIPNFEINNRELQVAEKFIQDKAAMTITVSNVSQLQFAIGLCKSLRHDTGFKSPVVIIMDECEGQMQASEAQVKNILDSNDSLDNCLLMFTTNYINKIPDAIKNRPSRIKECVEFTGEEDEIRVYNIFKNLNNSLPEEMRIELEKLNPLVDQHLNSTIDEIKHTFLDVAIRRNTITI